MSQPECILKIHYVAHSSPPVLTIQDAKAEAVAAVRAQLDAVQDRGGVAAIRPPPARPLPAGPPATPLPTPPGLGGQRSPPRPSPPSAPLPSRPLPATLPAQHARPAPIDDLLDLLGPSAPAPSDPALPHTFGPGPAVKPPRPPGPPPPHHRNASAGIPPQPPPPPPPPAQLSVTDTNVIGIGISDEGGQGGGAAAAGTAGDDDDPFLALFAASAVTAPQPPPLSSGSAVRPQPAAAASTPASLGAATTAPAQASTGAAIPQAQSMEPLAAAGGASVVARAAEVAAVGAALASNPFDLPFTPPAAVPAAAGPQPAAQSVLAASAPWTAFDGAEGPSALPPPQMTTPQVAPAQAEKVTHSAETKKLPRSRRVGPARRTLHTRNRFLCKNSLVATPPTAVSTSPRSLASLFC